MNGFNRYSVSMKQAFALKELFVVIAVVIAVLAVLLLAQLGKAKNVSRHAYCKNALKQLSISFQIWSDDHNNKYPLNVSTNNSRAMEYATNGQLFRALLCLSNELTTPKILTCPFDQRQPATNFATLQNSNISYFLGLDADETKPQMFRAGDRNLALKGMPIAAGIVTLNPTDAVSWTKAMHNQEGNLALADGSVQTVNSSGLSSTLIKTGTNLNRLVIP